MLSVIIWSVIIVIFLIVFFVIFTESRNRDSDLSSDIWQNRWQQIEKYAGSNEEAAWRLAVIEADKFLDGQLKFKGIGGSSLGDRLKIAQAKYKDLRAVWPAHLLRNKLVHEPDYKLRQAQAKQAVKSFYRAARILGFKKS